MSRIIEFAMHKQPHPIIPDVQPLTMAAISTLMGTQFAIRDPESGTFWAGNVYKIDYLRDGAVVRLHLSEEKP